jgi:DNA (cytosine-5)-methyltransferase 1
MGFDLPSSSNFVIPVSDTQAYKQFGNAVVPAVVAAVAKAMLPYITGGATMNPQLSLPLKLRAG